MPCRVRRFADPGRMECNRLLLHDNTHHLHRRRQHGQRHHRRTAQAGHDPEADRRGRTLCRSARQAAVAVRHHRPARAGTRAGKGRTGGLGRQAPDLQGRGATDPLSHQARSASERGRRHPQRQHRQLARHAAHRAGDAQYASPGRKRHDRVVWTPRRHRRRPAAGGARDRHHRAISSGSIRKASSTPSPPCQDPGQPMSSIFWKP